MGSINLEELPSMAVSSEDACNKLSSRDHYDALVSSTDMSGAKNNGNLQENEERLTESPPSYMLSCTRDSSPNTVMDAAGHSSHVRHVGQSRSAENDRLNVRGKDTTPRINVSETVSDMKSLDTSSGNDLSKNTTPRVRARPARFRQPIEVETSATNPTKPKKKASPASDRKKSVFRGKMVSHLLMIPAPKNAKSVAAGSWTAKEQKQFRDGCMVHGWGNWCAIENCIPTRNRNQVKSHAQKFQKHHPGERIRLGKEHTARSELIKWRAPAKNTKAGTKKRKLQHVADAPLETMSKSKKPSELDAPRKHVKASKRAPQTKEVKAPVHKVGTAGLSTIAKPHEANASKSEKRPALELDAPRKRHQAVAKCAPPTKKGKAVVHENGTPGAGPWTSTEQEQFKDGCILAECAPPTKKGKAVVPENGIPGAGHWKFIPEHGTPGAGPWTFTEQEQFKDACILYGWGNWTNIESCIPTRTNAQVKSHAQKFQKHHPEEKQRTDMEHTWRSELIKRRALAEKAIVQKKKKLAATRRRQTKNEKSPAQRNDAASRGLWSYTEQKQFEDGCMIHGWGTWRDIASHIPTRNRSQVKSHAQKFETHHAGERERLESEHKRHYQHVGGEASIEKTSVDAENTKVHHILLSMGKTPGKKSKLHSISTPETTEKTIESTSHVPSPQGSTHKTTVDDLGAAEAILALNFARWDNDKNGRETESPSSEEIGLKETSTAISSKANDVAAKNENSDASVDSQQFEDEAMSSSEEIGSDETSTAKSCKAEEVALKISEDADVSVESQNADDEALSKSEKTMAVESNDEVKLTPQDSSFADRNTNSKGREDSNFSAATNSKDKAPILKCAPIRPNNNMKHSSQPPPHWLAADTWDACVGKIKLWNSQLSSEEQNMEYLKYNRLTGREKERLRKKLVILMNNRPPTLPASDQILHNSS